MCSDSDTDDSADCVGWISGDCAHAKGYRISDRHLDLGPTLHVCRFQKRMVAAPTHVQTAAQALAGWLLSSCLSCVSRPDRIELDWVRTPWEIDNVTSLVGLFVCRATWTSPCYTSPNEQWWARKDESRSCVCTNQVSWETCLVEQTKSGFHRSCKYGSIAIHHSQKNSSDSWQSYRLEDTCCGSSKIVRIRSIAIAVNHSHDMTNLIDNLRCGGGMALQNSQRTQPIANHNNNECKRGGLYAYIHKFVIHWAILSSSSFPLTNAILMS